MTGMDQIRVAKKMFTVTLKEQEQWEGPVKVNGTD
jgi:hypothetical protein